MPRQHPRNNSSRERLLFHLRRFSLNTVFQVGSQVLPLIAGAMAIPLIYRNVGKAEFGVFTVGLSMLGLFALLDLGLGRSTVRFMSRALSAGDLNRAESVFSYSAALLGGFSLLLSAGLLAVIPYIASHWFQTDGVGPVTVRHCLYILAAALPLAGLTSVFRAVLEANDRFFLISVIQVLLGISTYVAPLGLSFVTRDMRILVAGAVACRGLAFLAYTVAARIVWKAPFRWKPIEKGTQTEFREFSTWLVISNVVGSAIVYGDRALLVRMFGLGEIAFYNIPLELLGRFMIIVNSAATVIFPALSRAASNKKLFENVYSAGTTLLSAALGAGLLTLSIVTPFALQFWLGADFRVHSTAIVQVLLIGLAFQTLNVFALASLNARGFARPITLMHLIETPFYFWALYACGQKFGLIGIASAWSGRLVLEYLCFVGFQAAIGDSARLGPRVVAATLAACNIVPLAVVVGTDGRLPAVVVAAIFMAASSTWAINILRKEADGAFLQPDE